MTAQEAMRSGEAFDPLDRYLLQRRRRAKLLCQRFNQCDYSDRGQRAQLLKKLMPSAIKPFIESDFYCDYGDYIHIDEGVFINHHCVFLDGADIAIGQGCTIGPGVVLSTVSHQVAELSKCKCLPITLGPSVWVGANATILAGVNIGEAAVIGAGAVVTQSVAAYAQVVGVPAKPLA